MKRVGAHRRDRHGQERGARRVRAARRADRRCRRVGTRRSSLPARRLWRPFSPASGRCPRRARRARPSQARVDRVRRRRGAARPRTDRPPCRPGRDQRLARLNGSRRPQPRRRCHSAALRNRTRARLRCGHHDGLQRGRAASPRDDARLPQRASGQAADRGAALDRRKGPPRRLRDLDGRDVSRDTEAAGRWRRSSNWREGRRVYRPAS